MMGGITVRGYEGKEIIVESKLRDRPFINGQQEIQIIRMDEKGTAVQGGIITQAVPQDPRERKKAEKAAGMKRLSVSSTDLEIEEEKNVVTIRSGSWKQPVDVTIHVPFWTVLNLNALNIGNIIVENVNGTIEAQGNNGSIILKNVSGTIIAHAGGGDIRAAFSQITPEKPMFFSTMDGDIDVTLPAEARVNLKMRSRQGDIFYDFDIALKTSQKIEETRDRDSGKYRVSFNKYTLGVVNGGGPELTIDSFNGDIYIRKKK